MEFVLSHFNFDSPLPSFFELYAQQEIMPALRESFRYALQAFAQEWPRVERVVPWTDEVFHSLLFLLDRKFLACWDATFAEHFYNMMRAPAADPPANGAAELSPSDRRAALLSSVLCSYLQTKLWRIHSKWLEEQELGMGMGATQPERGRRQATGLRRRLALALRRLFHMWLFPAANGAYQLMVLVYYVAYLFDRTQYFTPLLALQGQVMKRLGQADMQKRDAGSQRLSALSKTGLVLAFVLYKVAQWYYVTGRASPEKLPVPPPPEPTLPLPDRLLPADLTRCPICTRRRANPTLLTQSGHVFCYACIQPVVQQTGKCPVTGLPATVSGLRRLFEPT